MSNQILNYKGYQGSVEVDLEEDVLYGKILWVSDLITYESNTIEGIRREFKSAVDEYLEFCKEKNMPPNKPSPEAAEIERTQQRLEYVTDTIGSVFHACLRQVCDSEPANTCWHAIRRMDGTMWGELCGVVAEQIIFGWDQNPDNDKRIDIVRGNIEHIHTALRKFADGPEARISWEAIRDLPTDEWVQVVEWTTKRVVSQLEKFEQ